MKRTARQAERTLAAKTKGKGNGKTTRKVDRAYPIAYAEPT